MEKKPNLLAMVPKNRPLDNLDLDVLQAQAAGYGCRYGRYKADHPNTKAENEALLAAVQKKPTRVRPVYVFYCKGCGEKFTTHNAYRRYCGDDCKKKKENAKCRAEKQEVAQ